MTAPGPALAAEFPPDVETVAPAQEGELAEILSRATAEKRSVAIWGGGTHRAMGHEPVVDLVVSTARMSGVEDWEPDDLTVVVGAGTPVAELEALLAGGGQTAVLPELAGQSTVGGAVATATSGYRRLRYGPTRDRLLEVRAVTGDGRVVKGGGRVVKNVSGYDLPRLYTGSFGSLGVITSVCLKLWPLTESSATVTVAEARAADSVHRPLAVLQTPREVTVLVAGTRPEVEDQVRRLGGDAAPGLSYPGPVDGHSAWSLRVPPSHTAAAVDRLHPDADHIAQHGIGEVTFGVASAFDVTGLRQWAESLGGAVVRLRGAPGADPWGTPPPGIELSRRVVAAFDPGRVLEPGRLPGGI
ncbi:MAG TPA: FAD-binding protein [Acidimicrobiia bacterium]|nr:FAD-binding protein [Acidimicrobiia bacterium]